MNAEYEIPGGVRRCVRTDQVLRPSDHYYSLLREDGSDLLREDYSADAWLGAPEGVVAWWESKPADNQNAKAAAPNEVLLKLFDQWADEPDKADARFVITLLLVRRRVFRAETTTTLPAGEPSDQRLLRVYCPRRDESYDVPEQTPAPENAAELQTYLSDLLAA